MSISVKHKGSGDRVINKCVEKSNKQQPLKVFQQQFEYDINLSSAPV